MPPEDDAPLCNGKEAYSAMTASAHERLRNAFVEEVGKHARSRAQTVEKTGAVAVVQMLYAEICVARDKGVIWADIVRALAPAGITPHHGEWSIRGFARAFQREQQRRQTPPSRTHRHIEGP